MKVTIFSTKGSQKATHETQARTWGELKQELSNKYDFASLQATENIRRTDLTVDSAILPEQDFTLFLRPIKTKSGTSYSYKEVRGIISKDIKLQSYIKSVYGKNYTNLSTETLNEAVDGFKNFSKVYILEDLKNRFSSWLEEHGYKDIVVSLSLKDKEDDIEALEEEAQEIFGDID